MRLAVGILAAASLLLSGGLIPTGDREMGEPAQTPVVRQKFTSRRPSRARSPTSSTSPDPDDHRCDTTADPAPCVVILHGHDVETAYYHELAAAVAEKGIAVFVPDSDDTLPSNEDSRTTTITTGLDDVADAMRFVRLHAERYGGDPARVVIVGHSFGAVAR